MSRTHLALQHRVQYGASLLAARTWDPDEPPLHRNRHRHRGAEAKGGKSCAEAELADKHDPGRPGHQGVTL